MASSISFSYLLLINILHSSSTEISPVEFAKRVGDRIVKNADIFFLWEYGGALIFDGLFLGNETFGLDYSSFLDKYLNSYQEESFMYGYKILHNQSIPFGEAIGDGIGLFPVAYLNRIISEFHTGKYSNSSDWKIVNTVVNKFILEWPRRLRDGTFSREEGWNGEHGRNSSFLWVDDIYMGLTLLARLAAVTHNDIYAREMIKQTIQFTRHMQDPSDSLFYHGYNEQHGKWSCCKWGRGNGWAMMSYIEALTTLRHFKSFRMDYHKIIKLLNIHAASLLNYQSPDGRWHQVLNETTTYLETSCTAMFLTSFTTAVTNGWLPYGKYSAAIDRAWRSLQSTVRRDGTVSGICVGTGIQSSVAAYEARPTAYLLSADGGLGSLLYAAISMQKYLHWTVENL